MTRYWYARCTTTHKEHVNNALALAETKECQQCIKICISVNTGIKRVNRSSYFHISWLNVFYLKTTFWQKMFEQTYSVAEDWTKGADEDGVERDTDESVGKTGHPASRSGCELVAVAWKHNVSICKARKKCSNIISVSKICKTIFKHSIIFHHLTYLSWSRLWMQRTGNFRNPISCIS